MGKFQVNMEILNLFTRMIISWQTKTFLNYKLILFLDFSLLPMIK